MFKKATKTLILSTAVLLLVNGQYDRRPRRDDYDKPEYNPGDKEPERKR